MTFKKAALKLLSCGLRTRGDEDRTEVAEAIAWAIWALMEQARYEDVDVSTVQLSKEECNAAGLQTKECSYNTINIGDHVEYCGNHRILDPDYYPSIGTVGVVNSVDDNGVWVQWPEGSTFGDDLWHAQFEDVKFVEIP